MNTATSQAPVVDAAAPHPVQLSVERHGPTRRLHVITRAIILVVLAAVCSSSVYWICYLGLPALVALLVMQKGGERALAEEGPRTVGMLRWLASAYAYLWLLTDTLPTSGGSPTDLRIDPGPPPTPTSALLRLVYSLPALVVLAVLTAVACVLWLVGAVYILAVERMPTFVRDFLTSTLRYQFRLFAYHLSLTDRYPSL